MVQAQAFGNTDTKKEAPDRRPALPEFNVVSPLTRVHFNFADRVFVLLFLAHVSIGVLAPIAAAMAHHAEAGEGAAHNWELAANGGWYDFEISAPDTPGYWRRQAGTAETGR
jgi:hypothetical protein